MMRLERGVGSSKPAILLFFMPNAATIFAHKKNMAWSEESRFTFSRSRTAWTHATLEIFSIIAHIDHGKRRFQNRLLHRTGTITTREMEDQLLDSMDLEKEPRHYIKAHPVTMFYQARTGEVRTEPDRHAGTWIFPMSLAQPERVRGCLLIIDAAQGVEAQTSQLHLAMKQNLAIIPVINKIDLPHADVAQTKQQLEDILAIPAEKRDLARPRKGLALTRFSRPLSSGFQRPANRSAVLGRRSVDSISTLTKAWSPRARVQRRAEGGISVNCCLGKNVEVKSRKLQSKPYVREKLEVGETGYLTANIKTRRK